MVMLVMEGFLIPKHTLTKDQIKEIVPEGITMIETETDYAIGAVVRAKCTSTIKLDDVCKIRYTLNTSSWDEEFNKYRKELFIISLLNDSIYEIDKFY
jgi:hypothetical protein